MQIQTLHSHEHEDEKRFSHAYFFAVCVLQTVFWFTLIYFPLNWLWPGTWDRQLAAGIGKIAIVIVATHLVMCFFEYFFHRYVLHAVALEFLATFARKHRHHHGLTHVVPIKSPDSGEVKVRNKYPIVEPEQHESSVFPMYALVSFWGLFTPAILLVQWLMPHAPIVIGGYLGVAWSYYLYETWHAIEHLPFDSVWSRLTTGRMGWLWRPVYGFHLMHHYNPKANEAISGFFCLPLADLAFGTFALPKKLPLDGETPHPSLAQPLRPRWIVRWLDGLAQKSEERYNKKRAEQALKKHKLATKTK